MDGDWPKMGWGHRASGFKVMQIGRTVPGGVSFDDAILIAVGGGELS